MKGRTVVKREVYFLISHLKLLSPEIVLFLFAYFADNDIVNNKKVELY